MTASNIAGSSAPQTITITIGAASAPLITSAPVVDGIVGLPLTYVITTTGSTPMTLSTSALPTGLSFAGTTISGTPTAAGTTNVTLTASNAGGTAHATLAIVIAAAVPPLITSPLAENATVGTPFSYTITASGTAPLTLGVVQPLPAGLSFDGVASISGTPSAAGTPTITLTAANGVGQTTQASLVLTISAPVAPAITSALTAAGVVGVPFSYTITASGSAPITFAVHNMPPGLVFDGVATISGTPTAAAVYPVLLDASNAAGGAPEQTLEVTIVNPVALTITSPLVAAATVGAPFSYTITASGTGPITFGATGVPSWLTLTGAVLSGIPPAAGVVDVMLTASNSLGAAAPQTLAITVGSAIAPQIISMAPTSGVVGASVSYLIQATGSPVITFSTSALPSSWSIGPTVLAGAISQATLSGTVPDAPGPLQIVITAANAGGMATQTMNLTIIPLPPQLSLISPTGGPTSGGTSVTLVGTNLAGATAVTFDGLSAAIVSDTATTLVVTTPVHNRIGLVDVAVTTPGGTVTAPAIFAYVPIMTIISIGPSTGSTAGGSIVTVVGSHLSGLQGIINFLTITIGGLPVQLVSINDAEITFATPPHAAGPADVVISSLAGTITLTGAYTYVTPGTTTATGSATGTATATGTSTEARDVDIGTGTATVPGTAMATATSNGNGNGTWQWHRKRKRHQQGTVRIGWRRHVGPDRPRLADPAARAPALV